MGYDLNRFQGEVDDEFKCPICCMVLEDAVQSPECEHTFCAQCINEWLTRQSNCPVDRQPLRSRDLKPAPRVLRNFLAKLDIKCDFAQHGCSTIVKLELLQTHINECDFNPFKPIICEKGCGLVLLRNQVEQHNCLSDLRELVGKQEKKIKELKNAKKQQDEQINELKSAMKRVQEEQLVEQNQKLNHLQNQVAAMQHTIDQLLMSQPSPVDLTVSEGPSCGRSSCVLSSGSPLGIGRKRPAAMATWSAAAKRLSAGTPPRGPSNNDSDSEDEPRFESPLTIPLSPAASPLSSHYHHYHCSPSSNQTSSVCSGNRLMITFYGSIITVNGGVTDTIQSIKEKISEKEGIPAEEQLLFFAGQQLEDEKYLRDYNIQRHSHLESTTSRHLVLRLKEGMKIFVKTLSEKVIEVVADPNDLIEIIKVKIHEQEGISPCDQRLLLNGHDLADLRTLADYGIKHKSTLQLDLHLGGPCPICQSQFSRGSVSSSATSSSNSSGKGKGKGKGKGFSAAASSSCSSTSVGTSTSSFSHGKNEGNGHISD